VALTLSAAYEQRYVQMLEHIAATPRISPRETSLFWPQVGAAYDGDLLLVGRAVNGWIDRWDLDAPTGLGGLTRTARQTSERSPEGAHPLRWVVDRWKGGRGAYNTATSQFWVTVRAMLLAEHPEWEPDWSSYLAWSNLAKVSRWTRGNPSWRLREAQLADAGELLRLEVEELAPRRILVLAGRAWFERYATALGLAVRWAEGLVEGVATDGAGRRWVIAVHPMTRSPRAVAAAALAAFALQDQPGAAFQRGRTTWLRSSV
jgi:hypothetical protein